VHRVFVVIWKVEIIESKEFRPEKLESVKLIDRFYFVTTLKDPNN